MQLCKRCLYGVYHPLNITFDEEGVCSGCLVHDEKNQIDWAKRAYELKMLVEGYKEKNNGPYDCIVPVSGARDSVFIVDYVINTLKLHPLLVTYNKHFSTREAFYNLALIKRKFDCDLITKTVDPATIKKITRATLRRFGSIYWHCIAGQTKFPVEIAIAFNVPLIIWGVHQGKDQVGMFSHHDRVEMTRRYRKEHDLMGYEAEDLISDFDFLTEKDINPFIYPNDNQLEKSGVRGIYLSNYIRWDTYSQHKLMRTYGPASKKQTRSFDNYNNADCNLYSDLHDYIKYVKHGYGCVVDHAVRDIRLGHITREEGIKLVAKYKNIMPRNKKTFLNWINIKDTSLDYILNQHRSAKVWKRELNFEWSPGPYNLTERLVSEIKNAGFVGDSDHFEESKKIHTCDPDYGFLLYGKGV